MSRDHTVAALVLAAGSSTRMGRNKMLLDLGGETILQRAVAAAVAAALDPVVVVTGHQADEAERQLDGVECTFAFNADHEVGIHTSVTAGIAHLPDSAGAAIVMLADMPFVTSTMLRDLTRTYRDNDAPLVISRYGGDVNAPPMLYDRSLFGELSVMKRRCGREVIKRHRHEALEIDWPAGALADIDTPEDYERIGAELQTNMGASPNGSEIVDLARPTDGNIDGPHSPAEKIVDPVCGLEVVAGPLTPSFDHDGTTYFFCCNGCRILFAGDPRAYAAADQPETSIDRGAKP